MSPRKVNSVKSATSSQYCIEALTLAVLEWFLLLILFLYALASYVITKFASYCGLKTPCLLCTRLDHIFENKKLGYYWDMICGHHKIEISSLVLCYAHDKLVDVNRMCEGCLFSFATINRSNAETYRLLVGKLGEDSYSEDTDSDDDHKLVSSGKKFCACCNEPWTSKVYAKKLMLTRSFGSDIKGVDYSVQGRVGADCDTQAITVIEQFRGDSHQKRKQSNQLTRVGYIKLKISSDTESDVLSDDDAMESLLKTEKTKDKELGINRVPMNPSVEIVDPLSVISSPVSNAQLDSDAAHEDSAKASFVEGVFEKMKSIEQEVQETNVALSSVPELISFADVGSDTDDAATPHGIMEEEDSRGTSKDDNFTPTGARVMSHLDSSPITANGKPVQGNQQFSDSISQFQNLLDLGDAYKLAVANSGKQLSDLLVEQWPSKDSSKVSQDSRNLFSQLSTSWGIEQYLSDLSPKVTINSDDLRTADASNSVTFQSVQKRISLERNESGLSIDGSIVSENEGESVIDRLKRRIDHDRKAMSALHKELEEERNSSAISTNQAMTMITRLQEEKAALQMEALQYLRMMEEQAEYDMESLQKTNDLLSEREKDIQDLEAELEFFRNKYPNESTSGNAVESFPTENSQEVTENIDSDESSAKADASDSPAGMRTGILKKAAVEIKEEKLHILSCLEKLEEKLAQSSKCRNDMDSANDDNPKVQADVQHDQEGPTCKGDESGDRAVDGYDSAEQIYSSTQGLCSTGRVDAVDDDWQKQRHNDDGHLGKVSPSPIEGVDITSLKAKYLQLLERMEALESDHRFLEHTINCLQIGEGGLQFIQDIASHLRELRTAEI